MLYKLRKIEATKWLKNGDHPKDKSKPYTSNPSTVSLSEGEVVRYFRHPEVPGEEKCFKCGKPMQDHGWIDQGGSGITVCPGSYVVTVGVDQYDVVEPDIFEFLFKLA
jgi:hypothetical protein